MANGLGIDPTEIRSLEFIPNGDGVLATFCIDYTDPAVKALQTPGFNVMPYLQANEDLANMLNVPYSTKAKKKNESFSKPTLY